MATHIETSGAFNLLVVLNDDVLEARKLDGFAGDDGGAGDGGRNSAEVRR